MVISLRDGASVHAELGQYDEALKAAECSFSLAQSHASDVDKREVLASAARLLQFQLFTDNQRPIDPTDSFSKRASSIIASFRGLHKDDEAKKRLQFVDQYAIIFASRLTAAELQDGSRTKALALGVGSIALGVFSESPTFVTNTAGGIGVVERYKTKAKHIAAGILAVGASMTPESVSASFKRQITK